MADLNDLELAELLNAAVDGPEAPKLRKNAKDADVGLFVHSLGLRASNKAVPVIEAYKAYNTWSKRPIVRSRFATVIGNFFRRRRILDTLCIYIDPTGLGLPSEYTITTDPSYKKIKYKVARKSKQVEYIGVYELKPGIFHAKILLSDGKYIPLGSYKFKKYAALAYDKAALQLYGKDAVLNFPNTWKDLLNGTATFPIKKPQGKGRRTKELKEILFEIFYKSHKAIREQKSDLERKEDQGKESKSS